MTVLAESYDALASVVAPLDDDAAWRPTGCVGWAVRDLLWHLHADAVRALVAAHTPADRAADCDAVAYWRSWGSDPGADERNRRLTRVEAGLHDFAALRERWLEASAAAVRAVSALPVDAVVATQGHAIAASDLASTLAVEATLHHLDLVAHLAGAVGPSAAGLVEVRRVVEALVGRDLPGWSDERVALVGTGRAVPTDAERTVLADVRLPLFS
ncbi:uncharacterized protein (TIGR03083 family) [Nocardioides cavernae]|uniref:Uncharacterized protein (TIGR03083 family) n=1 Tax=Nocardioides cavernae TaxID=1921566 RepID=A0A7Y9GZR6_9ACTN|nr:maleylpyruvate isomerase N-terminal domain-containing protein [Nocardioides cavernae]NYE35282.1 uncharacterized protein (TIGR03083 family) [Nocardioides cavernae]